MKRYIDTKFWSDSYISELGAEEKLLYLYFLTNGKVSICGIYELPIKHMATETDIGIGTIEKALKKFEKAGKIFYVDGFIIVNNYLKYQNIKSEDLVIGIKREFDLLPESIKNKVKEVGVSHGGGGGVSAGSSLLYYTILNYTIPNYTIPTDVETSESKKINECITSVMQLFKSTVNPTINFGHKTNRQAIKDLLALGKGDVAKLMELVEYAISVQGKNFAPTITTPYQLREKLGALKIYAQKENSNKVKIIGL